MSMRDQVATSARTMAQAVGEFYRILRDEYKVPAWYAHRMTLTWQQAVLEGALRATGPAE